MAGGEIGDEFRGAARGFVVDEVPDFGDHVEALAGTGRSSRQVAGGQRRVHGASRFGGAQVVVFGNEHLHRYSDGGGVFGGGVRNGRFVGAEHSAAGAEGAEVGGVLAVDEAAHCLVFGAHHDFAGGAGNQLRTQERVADFFGECRAGAVVERCEAGGDALATFEGRLANRVDEREQCERVRVCGGEGAGDDGTEGVADQVQR